MSNEFRCSDCGGDGTRCRCHEKRQFSSTNYYAVKPTVDLGESFMDRKKVRGKIEVSQEEWDRISDDFASRNVDSPSFGVAINRITNYMSKFRIKKSKK